MIFKNLFVLLLWTEVRLALEGLRYCIVMEILILYCTVKILKVPVPTLDKSIIRIGFETMSIQGLTLKFQARGPKRSFNQN